ncbi:uncharacterized protein LOC116345152 [Contarinia nasturtii]|uniref:uncharacterized protein LOC116345152 n=1 Tax=Contarinia nasturtii TaxID=265458 RepID=UPI0012D45CCF|nr:uncharacterized protein LOC116345152 [Contarinia nasturtii]
MVMCFFLNNMRPLYFIFFASVFALLIQSSCAVSVREELAALRKTGTASVVLKQINDQLEKEVAKPVRKKLVFDCSSIVSLSFGNVIVNAKLKKLRALISDVLDAILKSKLSAYYETVNAFSSIVATMKKAMEDSKQCCELYQSSQKEFLDRIGSNKDKLGKSLMKIQPFESNLLQHFINVPNMAQLLKLTIDGYSIQIDEISTKIIQLLELDGKRAQKLPEYKQLTANLNLSMNTFAKDDRKVLKALNNDITKMAGQSCPNITKFFKAL